MAGFIPPSDDVLQSLSSLTGDMGLLDVRQIVYTNVQGFAVRTRGNYYLDEEQLKSENIDLYNLLHGRAYVIDRQNITTVSSSSPITFYIAADKGKGLIIPARSLSIDIKGSDGHYRWTDDGENWTDWITLPDGAIDSYLPQEQDRFAEIQIYVDKVDTKVSLRSSR